MPYYSHNPQTLTRTQLVFKHGKKSNGGKEGRVKPSSLGGDKEFVTDAEVKHFPPHFQLEVQQVMMQSGK
jgi:hypothetical protein